MLNWNLFSSLKGNDEQMFACKCTWSHAPICSFANFFAITCKVHEFRCFCRMCVWFIWTRVCFGTVLLSSGWGMLGRTRSHKSLKTVEDQQDHWRVKKFTGINILFSHMFTACLQSHEYSCCSIHSHWNWTEVANKVQNQENSIEIVH